MRGALSEPVLRWVAGLLLVALLAVAWFQHRWLEQLHTAQSERQVADLATSLEALRDAFDHRFFSWALAHELVLAGLARQPGLAIEPPDDLAGTVIARYYRSAAGESEEQWFQLEVDGSSRVLEEPPRVAAALPLSVGSLLPYPLDSERLVVLLAEVPHLDALATKLRQATTGGGLQGTLRSPGPVMLVVLDRQRFIAEVLEPIAERTLPMRSATLEYALIESRPDLEEIVYPSTEGLTAADLAPADGEVHLLGPEAMMREAARIQPKHGDALPEFCVDCGPMAPVGLTLFVDSEPDRRWLLRIRARDSSLVNLIDQLRVRNLVISLSGLAVLGSAIVLLVVLALRAQRLARTQMEFVSGVSHELRTPLAVMASAASNMAGGLIAEPQQVRQYGEVLRRETRRLQELIERVLTFAKLDEGVLDLAVVNVGEVIERVVAAQNDEIAERGLDLEVRVPVDLPAVRANATALESALRNLLDNAIRYGSDGGRLRIEAVVERSGPRPELRITVQDWGEGIESREQKQLFEPFFRGRRSRERQLPGTGLGLSLVKRIATALGGRVRVDSTLGTGSQFHLYLPLASQIESPT